MKRVKFQLEFLFRASRTIVYQFLTEPDCLIRWFCDECKMVDDTYIFEWDGGEEVAEILEDVQEERITLEWEEYAGEGEYLDFKLSKSEVTGETILEITAFCDEDEVEQEEQFWATQIKQLKRAMGE